MTAVVSEESAKLNPYPVVYVNTDGSVRELHAVERNYLETSFEPGDGGRPYIKKSYESKDGWGDISGFCYRCDIPKNIVIQDPPLAEPKMSFTKEEMIAKVKEFGYVLKEDGSYARIKACSKRWWQFWKK